MTLGKMVDGQAIERLVQQVRGVMAVRVVPDSAGQIGEVHVVGEPSRSAKQMVRDVESIIYVRGGMRVDHRKISLVQLAETAFQPPPLRARLIDVAQHSEGAGLRVSITLGLNKHVLRGQSSSAEAVHDDGAHLAAEATLTALNAHLGAQGQLRLGDVALAPFDGMHVCLAHVSLLADEATTSLIGVAVVRDNARASAARATLDAVNRTIERLLA